MKAIFTLLASFFTLIHSIVKIAFWLLQGMLNYSTVMLGSVNTLTDVVDFLPGPVAAGIMAACGVLVTLRLVGRS